MPIYTCKIAPGAARSRVQHFWQAVPVQLSGSFLSGAVLVQFQESCTVAVLVQFGISTAVGNLLQLFFPSIRDLYFFGMNLRP